MKLRRSPLVASLVAIAAVAIVSAGTPSLADTIYLDTFTRTGNLLNSAPDVGASTWKASTWTTDGNTAYLYGSGNNMFRKGYLSFAPEAGNVYTLSADVSITTGAANKWLGFGFSTGKYVNTYSTGFSDDGVVWTALQSQTSGYKLGANNGTGWGANLGWDATLPADGTHNLAITLDTTGASWAVSYLIDGVQFNSTSITAATGATIKYVGFGSANAGEERVDNFSLTTAVPEPSTLALLATGLIGLLCYAWRKQR